MVRVNRVELVMARRQIKALIDAYPVPVTFLRKTKVSDGAGGFTLSSPLPVYSSEGKPQIVTLVPFKRRMSEFLISTELGDVPQLPYVLLADPSTDIEVEDEFWHQGEHYIVKTLDIKREIRVAAQVDYFGGVING